MLCKACFSVLCWRVSPYKERLQRVEISDENQIKLSLRCL